MKNQDQIIMDTLESLAKNYSFARTNEERARDDDIAKNFLDFFIANKEEYKKYWNFYEEKKNENN